jgi:hypothetical protein
VLAIQVGRLQFKHGSGIRLDRSCPKRILAEWSRSPAPACSVLGFALIWHIWWMVVTGLVGAYTTFVVFAWRDHDEYEIPAEEVARLDRENLAARRGLVTAAGGA